MKLALQCSRQTGEATARKPQRLEKEATHAHSIESKQINVGF